jgi:hypothetical protein
LTFRYGRQAYFAEFVECGSGFSEICDLNEILSYINGELEPNVSGPGHSENKDSDQEHNIYNISVIF